VAVTTLCVDTSAYSRLMRGTPALQSRLEEADAVFLPATVMGELYAGFERGTRRDQNVRELRSFLAQPGVSALSIDDNTAERYGRLVQILRQQGTPIPTNDIWVAAATLETGGRLVSYDAHLQHVPGLLIESP